MFSSVYFTQQQPSASFRAAPRGTVGELSAAQHLNLKYWRFVADSLLSRSSPSGRRATISTLVERFTSFPRRRLIGSFLIYSLSPWLVLVALGLALGCPWLDLGAHLVPFELPLGALGTQWDPLEVPRGAHANFLTFVKNWTLNSEQMCLKYRACS